MKCVYAKDYVTEKNVTIAFRAEIASGDFTLKIAASNTYQVFVNGAFVAYGPMRSAHGYSNVSAYAINNGAQKSVVIVEVASYNIGTYYIVKEEPFFACEIVSAAGQTLGDTDSFKAYLVDDRDKKVMKYDLQRPFTESYRMSADRSAFYTGGGSFREVSVKTVAGNRLVDSELKLPAYERQVADKIIECGTVSKSKNNHFHDHEWFYKRNGFDAYTKDELDINLLEDACALKFQAGIGKGVTANRYDLYELPYNMTGFVSLEIAAKKQSDIYILFDEILYDEIKNDPNVGKYYAGTERPLVFWRSNTVNAVKWSVAPGTYSVLTFEPYTMKYLKVVVLGDASVLPGMILYQNSDVTLTFDTDDAGLKKVFDAARHTFEQNAVDVLTDCPSRERAGWLCDSYFTARTERLMTGDNRVEKNYLLTHLNAPQLSKLPEGMFPMCYPADHDDGNYIANWSLWLIIELKDYLKRTGDAAMIAAYKDKIYNLLKCMKDFENSDGLLEKVDAWVFVEWSKANEFVQDVNYPSNMLYSGALEAAGELYGDQNLKNRAAQVKEKILTQSFKDAFFMDNALRENGKLRVTENRSETCQYYAFYFNVATRASHPALYRTMFDVIAPGAVESLYPKLHKSNAFIGNYLRLDFLAREGRLKQVVDECGKYFLYMAERTGTLWENDSPGASCNHGFASLVAEWIVKAATGFSHVEKQTKTVYVTAPAISVDCNGVIPCEDVKIVFNVKNGIPKFTFPDGYIIAKK